MSSMESQEGNQIAAQAKIWKYIYAFYETMVLRCATELGIADIIHRHGGSITLPALVSEIPVKSVSRDHLRRIMSLLVRMGLFSTARGGAGDDQDGEPEYQIELPGTFLVQGLDKCMAPSIMMITDEAFMAPWYVVKRSLEEESTTAFEVALGKNIWDFVAGDARMSEVFHGAMACDTRLVTEAFVRHCGDLFDGVGSLVDVGGSTGTAARAVARAFPKMRCTVYDLPHVIADSPGHPEVSFVGGDMFKSIPNADAIMMKCVLHDWEDEDCIKILKKCKVAVPLEGGKVIIIDIVLDTKSRGHFNKMKRCMDLDMMIHTGGKERTEEEWKKLIYNAGFSSYKIRKIPAVQSIIEAHP